MDSVLFVELPLQHPHHSALLSPLRLSSSSLWSFVFTHFHLLSPCVRYRRLWAPLSLGKLLCFHVLPPSPHFLSSWQAVCMPECCSINIHCPAPKYMQLSIGHKYKGWQSVVGTLTYRFTRTHTHIHTHNRIPGEHCNGFRLGSILLLSLAESSVITEESLKFYWLSYYYSVFSYIGLDWTRLLLWEMLMRRVSNELHFVFIFTPLSTDISVISGIGHTVLMSNVFWLH